MWWMGSNRATVNNQAVHLNSSRGTVEFQNNSEENKNRPKNIYIKMIRPVLRFRQLELLRQLNFFSSRCDKAVSRVKWRGARPKAVARWRLPARSSVASGWAYTRAKRMRKNQCPPALPPCVPLSPRRSRTRVLDPTFRTLEKQKIYTLLNADL